MQLEMAAMNTWQREVFVHIVFFYSIRRFTKNSKSIPFNL